MEDAMFFGRGAGDTASAVVGDIFDIARSLTAVQGLAVPVISSFRLRKCQIPITAIM